MTWISQTKCRKVWSAGKFFNFWMAKNATKWTSHVEISNIFQTLYGFFSFPMTAISSQGMDWVLYCQGYSRGIFLYCLRFFFWRRRRTGWWFGLVLFFKFDSKIHFGCFLGCWVWCLYHSGGISEHPEPGYRNEKTSSVGICTVFWWSLWQGYRALSSRKHQGKQKPFMSSA